MGAPPTVFDNAGMDEPTDERAPSTAEAGPWPARSLGRWRVCMRRPLPRLIGRMADAKLEDGIHRIG